MDYSKNKKVTRILSLTIVTALLSVLFCVISSNKSYSAKMVVEEWNIELREVSNVIKSNKTIINVDPSIDENKIKLNVSFNEKGDYVQFFFDLVNEGTIDGIIKDIKFEGIKNKDKVRVSLVGLQKGDIIKSGRYVDNIKVIVDYLESFVDEEGNLQPITEDINVVIEIDKN